MIVLAAALLAITVLGTLVLLRPFLTRVLDLAERRVAAAERAADRPPAPPLEPVPVDLMAHAFEWGDGWARDDAIKRLQELRETAGSWDAVRTLITSHRDY